MIDHGVHGLFPVGTGGEFSALTLDEKKRLMDLTVKEVAGRAFVMPNVGAITTAESVALARHAEAVGCDAVSAVTPFFLKPSQEELFEHYRAICAAVKLPVLAYNIPERTGGVALSVATVVPAGAGGAELRRDQGQHRGSQQCGGVGPGDAAGVPGLHGAGHVDLRRAAVRVRGCRGGYGQRGAGGGGGDLRGGEAGTCRRPGSLQAKLAPVRRLFGVGSHPLGLKEAMVQLGMIECGRCRRPTLDITPAQKTEVTTVLREAGLTA